MSNSSKIQGAGIRAIFFDAAGTLFDVRGTVGEIYSNIASRYGIVSDPARVQKTFEEAFRQMPPMAFPGLNARDLTKAERGWWEEIVRRVYAEDMPERALRDYISEVFEAFRGAEAWELLPGTRGELERLRALGFRLGVISNFDSRLYDVLESLGIHSLLECVIISSRAGAAKPDAAIFHQALAAMGVAACEAIHVGDTLEVDAYGAQRAGLHAVLLDPAGRYTARQDVLIVKKLAELCSLLEA